MLSTQVRKKLKLQTPINHLIVKYSLKYALSIIITIYSNTAKLINGNHLAKKKKKKKKKLGGVGRKRTETDAVALRNCLALKYLTASTKTVYNQGEHHKLVNYTVYPLI